MEVHGITGEFLRDKPRFNEISDDFMAFVDGAELVIHNADFDVGFLEYELQLMKHAQPSISDHANVLDTLGLENSISRARTLAYLAMAAIKLASHRLWVLVTLIR